MPECIVAARSATVLLFVYAASQVNIARLLWPLGRDVVRLQSTTDPRVIRDVMGGWSPAQRVQYRRHLLPDSVHPLLYGAMLALAGRAALRPTHSRWIRWTVVAVPTLAGIFDLIENAFHDRFSAEPPVITLRAARLSGVATRIKWILAFGTVAWIGLQTLQRRQRS